MVVTAETQAGEASIPADIVLVAVGRRPVTTGLGLEEVGVKIGPQGFIETDTSLHTNVPGVYAIGDVRGPPFLAHKASKEGIVAAEAIAGLPSELDYQALPDAVFTDPEIATVGVSETKARATGRDFVLGRFPFSASGRALTSAETDGFVKVIAEKKSGRVLGVAIVGPEASDLISEAALAIEMGATAEDIALTIHPHPTLPESLMEAAEGALGRAIHQLRL
jgi:dihydrolipoamide dehydrogenase